jgi:aminoglycoside phosphotransferase (APT) family kinase protein
MVADIPQIFANFAVDGMVEWWKPIESGHINATFHVSAKTTGGSKSFLLQRINTFVFRDPVGLMLNIVRVTEHLQRRLMLRDESDVGRRVLHVHPNRQQQPYDVTCDGEYWRLYEYVNDTHTIQSDPPDDEIYEAAYGFGEFIASLTDLPWEQLTETIPNFHHGPKRYEALQLAIQRDVCGRAGECGQEIHAITEHHSLLFEPQLLSDLGRLPRRVTHNDAKCSNILIDNASLKSQCVIDLDTVMPGLALYDFGDLVRTSVAGAEDETNPAKAKVRLSRLECAARGFIDGAGGNLAPDEVKSLAMGPAYMALIMAVRFLTDYLQGDIYYRIHDPDHNLRRCRAQLALMRSLHNSRAAIEDVIGGLPTH